MFSPIWLQKFVCSPWSITDLLFDAKLLSTVCYRDVFSLWVKNICVHNVGTQCVFFCSFFFFANVSSKGLILGYLGGTVIRSRVETPFTFSIALGNHYSLLLFFKGSYFLSLLCAVHPLLIMITIIESVQNHFPFLWSLISHVYWLDQASFPISKRCYRMSGKAIFYSSPQV